MRSEIIDVDRTEAGIIVSFEDGLVVLYSTSLMRQMIPQAEILPQTPDPEPND